MFNQLTFGISSKRWFHNLFLKRCSKACICGNKPNQTKNRRSYFCLAVLMTWCRTAFSQPLIHGVPEVASSKISRNFTKIWEAIFVNSFLFLEADHFCHNLFDYFVWFYFNISWLKESMICFIFSLIFPTQLRIP